MSACADPLPAARRERGGRKTVRLFAQYEYHVIRLITARMGGNEAIGPGLSLTNVP